MKVEFRDVSKSYGIINALNNVNFSVDSGEFVFLVGPSGAGKSTALKLILRQMLPSSGQILLDDHNLDSLSKKEIENTRKLIGMIFQDYQLVNDKTVEENIALALAINGHSPNLIPARIEEVLKMVNLSTRRFLFPSQLSGGELQRTSLARAISINPKLILADEPTGNLDPENSWNLINLFLDINQRLKTTIIMTTHNYEIIKSLNKRIIKFDNGRVVDLSDQKPAITSQVKKIKKKHVRK